MFCYSVQYLLFLYDFPLVCENQVTYKVSALVSDWPVVLLGKWRNHSNTYCIDMIFPILFSGHWFLYSGAYLSLFCVEYIFSWNDFSPLFCHHWFISTWMSYIHGHTSYLVFSLLCYCFYHIGHNWWKSSHLQGFCTGERLACYSVGKMEKSFKYILYRYDFFLQLISVSTGLFIADLMFWYCLYNIYCICSTVPQLCESQITYEVSS